MQRLRRRQPVPSLAPGPSMSRTRAATWAATDAIWSRLLVVRNLQALRKRQEADRGPAGHHPRAGR